MNKEFLGKVSRVVDSVMISDSNKRLEEYLLGSLRSNGLETMVNIEEHKDGYRISEQGNRFAYADVYLDGEGTLVAGLSRNATGLNGFAVNGYAEFAGISREQARREAGRLFEWFADLAAKDGRNVDEIKDIKVTDAVGGMDNIDSDDFRRVEEEVDGNVQISYTLDYPDEYGIKEAYFVADKSLVGDEWGSRGRRPEWWCYVDFGSGDDWEGYITGTPDMVAEEIGDMIREYRRDGKVSDSRITGHGGTVAKKATDSGARIIDRPLLLETVDYHTGYDWMDFNDSMYKRFGDGMDEHFELKYPKVHGLESLVVRHPSSGSVEKSPTDTSWIATLVSDNGIRLSGNKAENPSDAVANLRHKLDVTIIRERDELSKAERKNGSKTAPLPR